VGSATYTTPGPIVLDVQSSFNGGSTPYTTFSCPSITPSAIGEGITVEFVYGGPATVVSVNDNVNPGNYLAANPAYYGPNPLGSSVGVYYKANPAALPTVITVTLSGTEAFDAVACQAWKSSAAQTFTQDTTFTQQNPVSSGNASGANPTTGSAKTPAQSNNLVIGTLLTEANTPSVGTGFSSLASIVGPNLFSEYQVQTTPTATNTPWVMTSDNWVAQMASFYFSSATPPAPPTAVTANVTLTSGVKAQ
jgi:hypothetical protein